MQIESELSQRKKEVASPSLIPPVMEVVSDARTLLEGRKIGEAGQRQVSILSGRNHRLYEITDVLAGSDFFATGLVIGGIQLDSSGHPESVLKELQLPRDPGFVNRLSISNLAGISPREMRKILADIRRGTVVPDGWYAKALELLKLDDDESVDTTNPV